MLQNEVMSHKTSSLPRLPSSEQQRPTSFISSDNFDDKSLVTHRSFSHLTSKKSYFYNNKRRGSDTTTEDDTDPKSDSLKNSVTLPVHRYANDKRNNDFHTLFRSVPENEKLIDDYGCALQKEILLQGRLYITDHHLCFNANIFGWITNLVISFDDIQEIEKKTTAIFIPNAILITTCTSKYFIASFLSRDQAFDQMVDIWKATRAINSLSTIEMPQEKACEFSDEEDSDYSSSDYSYSEEDVDTPDTATINTSNHKSNPQERQTSLPSLPLSRHLVDSDSSSARRRAVSESATKQDIQSNEISSNALVMKPNASSNNSSNQQLDENLSKSGASSDNPSADQKENKPVEQLKEVTECECSENNNAHFPTVVMDAIYPSTLETMYRILYNSSFMFDFLTEVEKSTDVSIGEWNKIQDCHSRESSYIKYLGGSIGPKSTKCYLKEEILHLDTTNYVSQLTVTQTPDVPSGGSFNVKTKTCISWAGLGQVRVLVTVLIEFTKSSWLKSTIERASIDGQQSFYKNLDVAIRKYLDTQSKPTKPSVRRRRKKPSKRRQRVLSHTGSVKQHTTGKQLTLSDCIEWCIQNPPTMTQLAAFFMAIMVITNIYMATKMAGVNKHLNQQSMVQSSRPYKSSVVTGCSFAYPEQEDTLWRLLTQMSSDKETYQQNSKYQRQPGESDLSDEQLRFSKSSKHQLDKTVSELEKMILQAGYNMNHINQIVKNHQRNILNTDWA